ncbi:MAG: hypothetical protein NZ822_02660, partial [Patescibacteria group bacterium]|nr:hypothetical protein [Patescibacteria group bacterium]
LALVVILIIPPILNMINPQIFRGVDLVVPRMTVDIPTIYDVVGTLRTHTLEDGETVVSVDNSVFWLPFEQGQALPNVIISSTARAYFYASTLQNRFNYASRYQNITYGSACNYFVYEVLRESGAIPNVCIGNIDMYGGASNFHNILTSKNFQKHARSKGFEWKVLPFNGTMVRPGDVVVRTKRRRGHGHVAIAVPVKTKKGGFAVLLAEASYTTSTTKIMANPEKYLPHINEIGKRPFNYIVRPVPIN